MRRNARIGRLLRAWRAEIEREQFPELVDTTTALALLSQAATARFDDSEPYADAADGPSNS